MVSAAKADIGNAKVKRDKAEIILAMRCENKRLMFIVFLPWLLVCRSTNGTDKH
jgi:hypothetical protein